MTTTRPIVTTAKFKVTATTMDGQYRVENHNGHLMAILSRPARGHWWLKPMRNEGGRLVEWTPDRKFPHRKAALAHLADELATNPYQA